MNTTARQGILYRLFAGGIPITALLTAIFYLQGKAYQAGFLHYFHIESTQMAITTADAMWNAYRGWGNGAATVLLQSRDLFIRALFELAPLVLIASLLAAASMLLFMRFKKESPNNSRPHPPVKPPPGVRKRFLLFFSVVVGYIFSLPAVIVLASLIVVITVSLTVEPFFRIGMNDATDFCRTPAAAVPTIPNLPGLSPENGPIYQLWCSTDTCAVMQSEIAYVVQKSSIPITTSAPLSLDLSEIQSTSYKALCTK